MTSADLVLTPFDGRRGAYRRQPRDCAGAVEGPRPAKEFHEPGSRGRELGRA